MSGDGDDLAARAGYRREAARVARPLRVAGLLLALVALALAIMRA